MLSKLRFHLVLWVRELIINVLIGSAIVPRPLRAPLLRLVGFTIGRRVAICAGFSVHGDDSLEIGSDAFINYGCFVDLNAPVTIGSGVSIGYRVQLLTATHHLGGPGGRAGTERPLSVTIGDGVWIGAGAIVLPGVRIGSGCVVAAGSVVRQDCRPNTLYAGNPASARKAL